MKKISLSILAILLVFDGICQPPKSKIVDASMPAGTTALTKEQVSQYMNSNFKRNGVPIDNKYLDVSNYYKKDGLIISFWDFKIDTSYRVSLESIGAGILGLLKRNKDTVNLYRIIKINGVKFLEYEYQQDNEIFLRFQSDADAKNQNICGLIQCRKPDEKKGAKLFAGVIAKYAF